ncbi:hypothetical protein F8M49_20730 [Rhodococcus zopfii]|uniref:Uncharacterized protein n=1 Tax=Rhodococcus zopfii TaxID=43772 RepID=A0ABU3WT27_9NOCA|nr:hypothetical protein [Rhodococcus zopfii]
MSERSVVDLVTERVLEDLPGIAEKIVEAAIVPITERVAVEVAARMGTGEQAPTAPDPKTDARDRALRTTVQGAAATVLIAVLLAVAELLGTGTLDLSTGGAWKAIAGTAGGAALMAVMAYVQRLIDPPKDR